MKASAFAFVLILSLISASCQQVPVPRGQVVVTTPTGRKEPVTRQYTIREIEVGSAAIKSPADPFDTKHPVYPQNKDLEELKHRAREGDQIWYFQGLDSGWAIIRDSRVVWVLVTNHEY